MHILKSGPETRDPGNQDQGPGTRDPRIRDPRPKTQNSGIWDLGTGTLGL